MEKTYKPQAIENRWYRTWEEQNYFAPSGSGPGYCIMLPPPNVTGSLHMGHAFQHTLMDILIRYHRMLGDRTLWQCGTDHAGIATQMVVERKLELEGLSRHDLGRKKFVEKVWEWKHESGNTISAQLRRLGTSMDWSRERFTMDEGLSRAVQKVFIDLYNEGLIYRGKRLVNWDPVLHTAISDLEVISEEESGHMWHIRYPVHGEDGHIIVATTRPETMLGDAAVAVHPEDERYRHLVGKTIDLPLTGRQIPVIEDDYVDPEFGSGCVKITPAHDFNDYAVGLRHDLPLINILTIDAALNDQAPEQYRDLDRYAARKQIVRDLDAAGLLEKTEPHKLMVPRGDRSGVVVEPYLTDQWYVTTASLAEPAIRAVEEGRIRFIPGNWSKTYFEWMRNIEDWCISRQLWWGHQIPAWYDDEGNIYVGESEQAIRDRENLDDKITLTQDEDVLDTWFSSALWPFSTLDWPEDSEALRTYYPTSVLVTGFDIIFFWVARMIMMGLKFMDDVPFREVYITGLIRDEHGQKMSKSKGNILDPIDLIDGISLDDLIKKRTTGLMRPKDADKIAKATRREFPDGIEAYGTDALRFTFSSLASPARNINFDIGRIGGYRNFCNKLWNATRYVLMSTDSATIAPGEEDIHFNLAERWIRSRLQQAIAEVTEGINTYRFDLASRALHEFTWDEYCDWYLELSKTTLTNPDASDAEKRGTVFTLLDVLERLLRLMHPFMPFITEELWQRVSPLINRHDDTIMLQAYPVFDETAVDESAVREIEWIKAFILGVRRIRAERDIAPGKPLTVQVRGGSSEERGWLAQNQKYIMTLGRIESITPVDVEPDDAVIALAGDMTLLVPLADLIDPAVELERLQKELDRLDRDQERIRKKLDNREFVQRAPQKVVNKEKQRLEEATSAQAALVKQYERIKSLLQ